MDNQSELQPSQIMTPKEAACYLGFHLVTIYRLLKRQEIPGIKIGKQWRLKRDVLDQWLTQKMSPVKDFGDKEYNNSCEN